MLETGAREKQGRYEPLFELASGGMATTFLARHVGAAGFERLVVLKRVHQRLLEDPGVYAMLADEARLASLVRHPNVVPVIDVVEDRGELMLVLEYVESMSLEALLGAARRAELSVPLPVVTRIVSDILAGLHAAHDATDMHGRPLELVHRDVTPHNVLVGVDGTSRLIDFGIAKAARRLTATTAGVLKGKAGYMPLEQLRQQPLDRRADVFAAGVVLYVALTGRMPFIAEDEGDLMLAMMIGEPPPPSTLIAGIVPTLDAVVEYALARSPDERFQTAAAFQQALETAVPPASPRETARLVAQHGAERLAQLRHAVRDALALERSRSGATTGPRAALPRRAAAPHGVSSAPPVAPPLVAPRIVDDIPRPNRSSSRTVVIAGVAVAAALTAGIGIARLVGSRAPAETAMPDARSSAVPTSATASAEPAPRPVSEPTPVASSGATAEGSASARPRSGPAPTRGARPARSSGELRENPYGVP